MNGKIDSAGQLIIQRNGIEKPQYCPYRECGNRCGDWCPLFGEPELNLGHFPSIHLNERSLRLCHTTLTFTEFTDERQARAS